VVRNLFDIRVPPMVPVSVRSLTGLPFRFIVSLSAWNSRVGSLGVPTLVL